MGREDDIYYQRKRDICIYLFNQYKDKITLDSMVKDLHYSKRNIERTINEQLDAGLCQAVNAIRLHKTIEQYIKHKTPIYKSAQQNGFPDRRLLFKWWNRWMTIPLDHQQINKSTIDQHMSTEYKELTENIFSCIDDNVD